MWCERLTKLPLTCHDLGRSLCIALHGPALPAAWSSGYPHYTVSAPLHTVLYPPPPISCHPVQWVPPCCTMLVLPCCMKSLVVCLPFPRVLWLQTCQPWHATLPPWDWDRKQKLDEGGVPADFSGCSSNWNDGGGEWCPDQEHGGCKLNPWGSHVARGLPVGQPCIRSLLD